jgi:dienelactone hydrolase
MNSCGHSANARKPIRFPRASFAFVVLSLIAPAAAAQRPTTSPDPATTRDVRFFSEGVQCFGRIYLPRALTAESKAAAVVLAPGWGETATSIEKYAARFASRGLVAMVIDYRGWGRSGGFLYLAEPLRLDDRLRFSQHTTKVRIRRKRLLPEAQVLDIRNAISYLQGEPGVDRTRIGVWGTDMAGGHVVVAAAVDVRIRAAVAQVPVIAGRDVPRKAFAPSAVQQAAMVRLARTGQAPATSAAADARNDEEARLALAEYHPFWYADAIPSTTAVLFVVAEKDTTVNNEANAVAASKLLKGPNGVASVNGATHSLAMPGAFETAVDAAAAWFLKYL